MKKIMIKTFIKTHKLPNEFKELAEQYYQPLTDRIYSQFKQTENNYFVGVNGCQGSGKSTLSAYIAEYLTCTYDLNIVVMSLDDFYLAQDERNKLAKDVHPMLEKRGVPGTHDTVLLEHVISALKNNELPISIPTFNKATDNPNPKKDWTVIDKPVDIIILEGWCWGVTAQSDDQLISPVNSLENKNDSDIVWRRYVNQQLKTHYEPLYQSFDYWIALQAPSFGNVYRWRLEQEQKLEVKLQLSTSHDEKSGLMSATQILNFIQYFQRLTEHGIKTLPDFADTTFFLDANRKIADIKIKAPNIIDHQQQEVLK